MLIRSYFPGGVNGEIFYEGKQVCNSIELPWKDNEPQVSCIPEGKYELEKRHSEKFGWHLLLRDVPERELILIHPANDAKKELQGCIAPVVILKAEGKGLRSRIAVEQVKELVYPALEKGEQVFLIIKTEEGEE